MHGTILNIRSQGNELLQLILKLVNSREKFIDIADLNCYSTILRDESLELETICNYLDINMLSF